MPKSETDNLMVQPKKKLQPTDTGLALPIRSDKSYMGHIFTVLIVCLVVLVVAGVVLAGFFYPVCNNTQNRGFYSCSCREGSALDLTDGYCKCLDTGTTKAVSDSTCLAYAQNKIRYVYEDTRPNINASTTGGWSKTLSC